jgi:pyridoxal/pyridoxine/pyridoxamine kinase
MCLQIVWSANLPVILDAGGTGIPIPQELLKCVTILTPNESEVAQLTGMPTNTWEQTIKAAAKIQSWCLVLLLQDMEYLSYRNCIFVAIPYVCECYG